MIKADIFKDLEPSEHVTAFAYVAQSLTLTARLALENDGSGVSAVVRCGQVANTLELVEAMLAVVIDGGELLERAIVSRAREEAAV